MDVFVCWVLMEILEVEEPGQRVCQVKFKDCQRAKVQPSNVKTGSVTKDLRCVGIYWMPEGQ